LHRGQPAGSLTGDVVEMRRLTADHSAQRDDRIEAFRDRQCLRGGRQLPRARYLDDFNILWRGARSLQRVLRANQQTICDETVESRDYNRELEAVRIEISFDQLGHMG
jgi:hypothetical protein